MFYLEMAKIYNIFVLNFKINIMEDLKQKLYRFYVLTSSEAPDEVRYVGVTTKKVG